MLQKFIDTEYYDLRENKTEDGRLIIIQADKPRRMDLLQDREFVDPVIEVKAEEVEVVDDPVEKFNTDKVFTIILRWVISAYFLTNIFACLYVLITEADLRSLLVGLIFSAGFKTYVSSELRKGKAGV